MFKRTFKIFISMIMTNDELGLLESYRYVNGGVNRCGKS